MLCTSGRAQSTSATRTLFDALHAKKEQVESVFGAPLERLRMDDSKASAITYSTAFDGRNQENWPEMIACLLITCHGWKRLLHRMSLQ